MIFKPKLHTYKHTQTSAVLHTWVKHDTHGTTQLFSGGCFKGGVQKLGTVFLQFRKNPIIDSTFFIFFNIKKQFKTHGECNTQCCRTCCTHLWTLTVFHTQVKHDTQVDHNLSASQAVVPHFRPMSRQAAGFIFQTASL